MLLSKTEEEVNTNAPNSLFRVEEMHQLRLNANLIKSTHVFAGEHPPAIRADGSPAWPTSHDEAIQARKECL